jgi:hypothetical protein
LNPLGFNPLNATKQTTEDMMMQVKEMKRRIAADSSTKLSSSNKNK